MRSFLLIILGFVLALTASAFAQETSGKTDPQAIGDLRIATGQKDIASAWLIAPTTRYPHFIIGSKYEPSGLRVKLANGKVLTLMLDKDQVFEDRTPRLADLNGDGRDEIILVLTSLTKGASLAAYSVAGDKLVLTAKTDFIGRAFRWLNPAGIADYDGDGRLDVALVQKPHLVKRLEMWSLEDGKFVRSQSIDDVSNHRINSKNTDMAASADFNGDGIVDLAILSGNYTKVRVFSFAGGRAKEIGRFDLPAPADGDFTLVRFAQGWQLRVPLLNIADYALNLAL
ncbi:hypothetical protein MNBD_ALPHA12-2094 [hydrothermal vent metagenome]|uniref:VCBS repeat-containing protein n=1 Tax=hydrothermal vent metagenome TaxID=652676 RepID=A0A3B0TRC1_9ZZZZ